MPLLDLDLPVLLRALDPASAVRGLALGLVAALVGMFVTFALGRRRNARNLREQNRRVTDLMHTANAIATQKNFSIRAVTREKDEIGLLADTFNQMMAQIQLHDERRENEVVRAEEATVAKATFLAIMSHEIRTPINGILGMAQLFDGTELTREQTEFIETIHQSAENLLSIINDILDFSKGEAGAYELESILFSPAEVVGQALDTVSTVASEKGIELCGLVDSNVPGHVLGDPARLRQVLLNLLSNAIKFTQEGEVALRVGMVANHGDTAELRFEVRDTGIGIPKDRLGRLFQSFRQVDASNTRKYGGTGLGLAISKQIVEAMGGSIYVKSKEGEGSIFGFRVEFSCDDPADYGFASAPKDLRILIVEENETTRDALAEMLHGNTLEVCTSGLAARRKLLEVGADEGFDLVVLDTRQGKDFGIDAGEAIPFPPVPIVLLTSIDRLGRSSSLHWEGRSAWLAKPVKRRELLWCIADVLSGASSAGPRPVTVPPTVGLGRPEPLPQGPRPSLDGIRVLVVEDHPVNQKITTRFLDRIGAAWDLASNGEEAIAAFKSSSYAMILMDVQMPVMDGLEATRTIRELERESGGRVPIIAMTAAVLEEDQRQCEEAGFDDYVPKPVKLSQLEERLRAWSLRVELQAA